MTEPACFWEDVYRAVEAGGRIESVLEPSRALLLFDTKAGDVYHLYIRTDKAWANHVAMDIEAVMNSFRLARIGREKLHVHIYGDPLVDEERLSSLTFPIAAKVKLEMRPCAETETSYRPRAVALDQQRKNELKQRFAFGKPQFVYALMFVTFLVMWVAESIGSTLDPNTLIRFGAKVNPLIDEGEWWRLITRCSSISVGSISQSTCSRFGHSARSWNGCMGRRVSPPFICWRVSSPRSPHMRSAKPSRPGHQGRCSGLSGHCSISDSVTAPYL